MTRPTPLIDDSTSMLMDRIRGVSALVVAMVHAIQVFLLPYVGLETPLHLGSSLLATYAVLAFFVVSGFMIQASIRRHSSGGRLDWVAYARARVLRIYPPLLAAVGISLLVYVLIAGLGLHGSQSFRLGAELFVIREQVSFDWSTLFATLFLTYGVLPHSPPPLAMNGPLWTLGYEFWFYFLVMFALNALAQRWIVGAVPFAIMLVMLLAGGNWLLLMFLVVWLAGYGLGAAYGKGWLSAGAGARGLVGCTAMAIVGIVALGHADLGDILLRPYNGDDAQATLALVGVIFTCVLGLVIVRKPPRARADWMVGASRFSYTLYVVHFPLLLLSFSLLHPVLHGMHWVASLGAGVVVLTLIVAIAERLSRVVENRRGINAAADQLAATLRGLWRRRPGKRASQQD